MVPGMGTFAPTMGTASTPDRVARVLFGSVRREVLALLFGRPDERFYLREIFRAVGGGSGAVQRELKQLADAGLIVREPSGRQVYSSANRDAVIYPELRAIVEKTAGLADVLRASLSSLRHSGRIELALVYGSVASGMQTERSDVDLLLVGEVTLADLVPMLRDAEARLGREVNPSVYPAEEFRQKLEGGAQFLRRIMSGPELVVAGGERELERLAG